MIKNVFVYIILILTLNSCVESKKKTSEFIYKDGESSVKIKILNGNDYLTYDMPIRVDFEWTNIDIETSSIYGVGIKILEGKNEITKTEINVPSNYLKKDTLNIKLSFEVKEEIIKTEFNIPVRNGH